ncbi:VOC family protein [Aquamicrobium sp. LC103]|uniref:VOC family protein n=1 Tax=Aquamicrobium sp. LC103 TaxID=1120658 RepID=UPI00063ED2B8|nr:VOC family protein [Aquamicrobium sp. LC103]TKT81398.1 glyoxalase [Aquamicrobium sp. LC103]
MTVKRIVANIAAPGLEGAKAFYGDILGMDVVMDHGWIVTFASEASTTPQISIATEGGSGTSVPDLSIEVDDLDDVHRRMVQAGMVVEYGPATEPWGVRRFYVRDPFGRLVNILAHV